MDLTESMKTMLVETAKSLSGSDRRLFMARTVKTLGYGGQRQAARELGWSRDTIRKGRYELDSGFTCTDSVKSIYVTSRFEKLASRYFGFVNFVSALIWLR